MNKLVGIICSDVGWIYDHFIGAFEKYSKFKIVRNSKEKCDIYHYIPYYELNKPKHALHPCTAWFSHMEGKDPLKTKFISVAKTVNYAISHSKKYAEILKNHNIESVKQIIPGVDLNLFNWRSTKRPENDKLVVGYVGRSYQSSSRKNPILLKKISQLPFVDFRSTNGKLDFKNVPKFIADLDICVSPATIEGGPMSIQQCLAVCTPLICYENVGVANEFSTGIIKVPFGNSKEFLSRLEVLWKTKSYMHYRKPEIMRMMRSQVKDLSWEKFAHLHDEIWKSLI